MNEDIEGFRRYAKVLTCKGMHCVDCPLHLNEKESIKGSRCLALIVLANKDCCKECGHTLEKQ